MAIEVIWNCWAFMWIAFLVYEGLAALYCKPSVRSYGWLWTAAHRLSLTDLCLISSCLMVNNKRRMYWLLSKLFIWREYELVWRLKAVRECSGVCFLSRFIFCTVISADLVSFWRPSNFKRDSPFSRRKWLSQSVTHPRVSVSESGDPQTIPRLEALTSQENGPVHLT